ncbi:DUF1932 domain-containing protein [Sphingomonas tabacisoli]|uniref:DUF1932 domain-containing protein n=1 Tax=Sphingomonas tabacisoli TaxID=2249466 RepID=A0ABW4I4Y8_9SPHN
MEEDAKVALIGFGEAATAFVEGAAIPPASFHAFDIKTDASATRSAKQADYAKAGVSGHADPAEAAAGASVILSLVTADQALAAAESVVPSLRAQALYCDLNSVAPQTKRGAAMLIERAGGRYLDVAVMSPVRPQLTAAPLLVSGPHAEAGMTALARIGFTNVQRIDGPVGAASAIKMIRSIMIKGLEALTAECMTAAEAAGVREHVLASLDASWPGADWLRRADYNLDRMLVHGLRRAAEMEEVVKTLNQLGSSGIMTRATVKWQRALGRIGGAPVGLKAKLARILSKAKAA